MEDQNNEGAVCPVPQREGWSAHWKNEDWLAVWIGFLIMAYCQIGPDGTGRPVSY